MVIGWPVVKSLILITTTLSFAVILRVRVVAKRVAFWPTSAFVHFSIIAEVVLLLLQQNWDRIMVVFTGFYVIEREHRIGIRAMGILTGFSFTSLRGSQRDAGATVSFHL